MTAPYQVRRVRLRDLDRILEIERASFGNDAYDRALFTRYLHRCGEVFLVTERKGRIWGYMTICVRGERAELVSVAVDPAARGKGAASRLMDSAIRRLRRRRVKRFGLLVRVSNSAAQAFYRKYGFETVKRVGGYYEDGEDGWLMVRKLEY